jgi:nitrile hydratase
VSSDFVVGERVRIAARYAPAHVRTPVYVRGRSGRIERVLARFVNPEREAYGQNTGGEVRLYRVRIPQASLWPDYAGAPDDVLEIEVFEHWLEKEPEERA